MSSPSDTADEPRDVWLSTSRPNGASHLGPIWFVLEDGVVWIATGFESVKVRNIAHDSRVQLGFPRHGSTEEDAVIEGNAVVVRTAPEGVLTRFESKYNWRPGPEPDPDVGALAFICVTPHRAVMGTLPNNNRTS